VRIEWSPLALECVEDIAQCIGQDDPEAARRWVVELFNTMANDAPPHTPSTLRLCGSASPVRLT